MIDQSHASAITTNATSNWERDMGCTVASKCDAVNSGQVRTGHEGSQYSLIFITTTDYFPSPFNA